MLNFYKGSSPGFEVDRVNLKKLGYFFSLVQDMINIVAIWVVQLVYLMPFGFYFLWRHGN